MLLNSKRASRRAEKISEKRERKEYREVFKKELKIVKKCIAEAINNGKLSCEIPKISSVTLEYLECKKRFNVETSHTSPDKMRISWYK